MIYDFHMIYCRIDESLCRVDDTVETEDSPIDRYDRCDTRATEAGEDTITYSNHNTNISIDAKKQCKYTYI